MRRQARVITGPRKRRERRMAVLAERIDLVVGELCQAQWTARMLARAGDGGAALRAVTCPSGRAVFVLAPADEVTPAILARATEAAEDISRRRRQTAGALPVIVTTGTPRAPISSGVLVTSPAGLAETLQFEADRINAGL